MTSWLLCLPILDFQPWYSPEFDNVVGHEDCSQCDRVACKQNIVGTDRLGVGSQCFKGCPHVGGAFRSLGVERFHVGKEFSEEMEFPLRSLAGGRAGDAIRKLVPADRRNQAPLNLLIYSSSERIVISTREPG